MAKVTLEVCCYNLESALNAQSAGADRIELCADRHQGGTTPSYGTLEVSRKQLRIPIYAMIRPRGGDFLYSGPEVETMLHDIQMCKELGIDGVVFGALTPEGQVDIELTKELVQLAAPMEVTFHRAFDLTLDPMESLEQIIDLGIQRILTSGQQATAFQGISIIKTLVEHAAGRIVILPGAGINEGNLQQILRETGVKEFHVSASGSRPSYMKYVNEEVTMGGDASEYTIDIAAKDRITHFRKLADAI